MKLAGSHRHPLCVLLLADARYLRLLQRLLFFPKRAKLSSSPLSNPQGNKLFSVSERVAVKIIDKGKLDGKTQKMVTREINIMDSLSHPNLIRYLSEWMKITKNVSHVKNKIHGAENRFHYVNNFTS